jgi:hypothetical protein
MFRQIGFVVLLILLLLWFLPRGEKEEQYQGDLQLKWIASAALLVTGVLAGYQPDARPLTIGGGGRVLNKEALKLVLRNTKQGVRSAAAGAAAAASMGLGGDTLVELSSLALEAGGYLAALGSMLASFANDGATAHLRAVLGSLQGDFGKGPAGMLPALEAVRAGMGDGSAVLAPVCSFVRTNIEKSIEITGLVISSFVPNDAGVAGWAATEAVLAAIRLAAGRPFSLFRSAYELLPVVARELLEDPAKLALLLNHFIDYLKENLFAPNKSLLDSAKKFAKRHALVLASGGLLLVPGLNVFVLPLLLVQASMTMSNVCLALGLGHDQVHWMLEHLLRPQVATLVELVRVALPFCFASLYWLETCQAEANGHGTAPPSGSPGAGLREAGPRAEPSPAGEPGADGSPRGPGAEVRRTEGEGGPPGGEPLEPLHQGGPPRPGPEAGRRPEEKV